MVSLQYTNARPTRTPTGSQEYNMAATAIHVRHIIAFKSLANITCYQTTNAKRTMRRMATQTSTTPKDSNHQLHLNQNQHPTRTTRTTTPQNPTHRLECPSQRSLPSSKSVTGIYLSKSSTMTTNHAA